MVHPLLLADTCVTSMSPFKFSSNTDYGDTRARNSSYHSSLLDMHRPALRVTTS